jgi:hypothetical protein
LDASYDLYLGPDKPDDVPEANGLRTNPGEGYLLKIRLYAPTEPFYDQSWILDDVAKIS